MLNANEQERLKLIQKKEVYKILHEIFDLDKTPTQQKMRDLAKLMMLAEMNYGDLFKGFDFRRYPSNIQHSLTQITIDFKINKVNIDPTTQPKLFLQEVYKQRKRYALNFTRLIEYELHCLEKGIEDLGLPSNALTENDLEYQVDEEVKGNADNNSPTNSVTITVLDEAEIEERASAPAKSCCSDTVRKSVVATSLATVGGLLTAASTLVYLNQPIVGFLLVLHAPQALVIAAAVVGALMVAYALYLVMRMLVKANATETVLEDVQSVEKPITHSRWFLSSSAAAATEIRNDAEQQDNNASCLSRLFCF